MSIAAERIDRLENIRDHVSGGGTLTGLADNAGVLTSEQCQQLATGFVGCNVVIDVTEFLCQVVKQSTKEIVPGIRYADIQKSWNGNGSVHAGEIVGPLAGEESFLRSHDPWYCINRWLAVEAIIRVVEEADVAEGERRRVGDIVLSIYKSDTLDDALGPRSCSARSSAAIYGFTTWWGAYTSALASILAQLKLMLDDLSEVPARIVKRMIGRTIANQIDSGGDKHAGRRTAGTVNPPAIYSLTARKNNQLHQCIASMNKDVTIPEIARTGWVRDTVQCLIDAKERRRRFSFRPDAFRKLSTLLDWVTEKDVERGDGRRLAALDEIVAQRRGRIDGDGIDRVIDELNELANVLRFRGRPVDWANYRPVEDLFGKPLIAEFDFYGWKERALDYGIPRIDPAL